MNGDLSTTEKILSDDLLDFVIRKNDFLSNAILKDKKIIATQTLSGRYIICYSTPSAFSEIANDLGTSFTTSTPTVLTTLDRNALGASGISPVQDQPYLNLDGQGVLVGLIDTGIDYTQDIFRYEDGTSKIQFIYDQSVTENPPSDFFIGTEYTNEDINRALQAENPFSIVPHKDSIGHGTFMASLVAGRKKEEFTGIAPEAEIIAVKLKTARPFFKDYFCIPKDLENVYESTSVMLGVEYIIQKSSELNRPVVICIGVGSNFGSHDGYSIFEEYLSGVSNLRGVCICTAAGNSAQEKHHMHGKISQSSSYENIDIKTTGESTDFLLSIWNNESDRFSVSIRSPTGELINRVPAKPSFIFNTELILEDALIRVSYHFPIEGSSGQLTLIRIEKATPGIWTVTLHGDIVLDGSFDAWLPNDRFLKSPVEFLSPTPYSTINIPATMMGAICCGAYDSLNNTLYADSSWGPSRTMSTLPLFVAPGVNVGGYYPYGYGSMSGTSVAMAITGGACVLLMEWGIVEENDLAMSTYQIRAYLVRGCTRSDTFSYPNAKWGYGTLNLMNSFQLMRES